MSILIEVTIFDEDTDEVVKKLVRIHESSYGYEIEATFEQLGEKVAKLINPNYTA